VTRAELDDAPGFRHPHDRVQDVGVNRSVGAVVEREAARRLELGQVLAVSLKEGQLLVEVELDPGELALPLPDLLRQRSEIRDRAVEALDDDL
jgi:hypothetical protein